MTIRRLTALSLLLLLAPTGSAFAQGDAKVPDPDPELERKSFQVADGFEVNLFAADPLLAKPIEMNFDPAGRLWVACSEAYPQIKPGAKQNDKIIILEDTKHVGRADKTTVFAEGLLIPTGLEPGDGGVYVVDSTDLLHLMDSKAVLGTDRLPQKADRRRVVLSGFGTEDTHHMVHTLRWGNDGMLYFNQSIYIHSHLETPHGPRHLNAGGIWQLRPETLELDVFARGWVNAWGHHFDRWGQSFVTDGAGGEGINYVIPGASYATAYNSNHIFPGLNPGSPKHCGVEVLSGRHLPEAWRGSLVTNDFRGHRVCRFEVKPDGAGYSSRQQPEVIKTTHGAFRPIDVKMGPDGAIYIADWYNPIIQHGEVDFRDPRRDHSHGRIWRVTAKGRALVPQRDLVRSSNETLLEALKDPEDFTRLQVRRVLKERGAKAVLPALTAWTTTVTTAKPVDEALVLEALWTYQTLDVVQPALLDLALHAADARVRAAAVRVVDAWHGRLARPLALLQPCLVDDNPQVRMEAVCALRKLPSVEAAEAALTALSRPTDRFLEYALTQTFRELGPIWVPALEQGRMQFGSDVKTLLFALQAAGSQGVVKTLAGLVEANKLPPERAADVYGLLAVVGGPGEMNLLLAKAGDRKSPAEARAAAYTALARAARERDAKPAGDLGKLVADLSAKDDDAVRAGQFRLAGVWRLEGARGVLAAAAAAPTTSDELRQAAVDGLAALGGKPSRDVLDQLAAAGPAAGRRAAVVALSGLDLKAAASRAAGLLAAADGGGDPAALVEAFLGRKGGGDALAAALGDKKLTPDIAKLAIRGVRSTGRDAPGLVAALTQSGGLEAEKELTAAELKQLVADVSKLGDPARGEAVFRRAEQSCFKCHALAGAGGRVGPELSSIGGSAPVDYLLESLLYPSKAIKEGYHATLVNTKKGLSFTGVIVREGGGVVVLRDADDKNVEIRQADIEDREMLKNSLMPEGLTDTLTRGELLDLVRYLSELGKVGPYAVSPTRVVRRWEVLEPTAGTWTTRYSTVAGLLPRQDIPTAGAGPVKVRCQINVTKPGVVVLKLNSAKGVRLEGVAQSPALHEDRMELELPAGVQTLTFALAADRKDGLRVEVDEAANSSARVEVVGGK